MRRIFLLTAVLSCVMFPCAIYAETPAEIDADNVQQDEETEEQDDCQESEALEEWCAAIVDEYVPVGQNGPIAPPYPPSILDSKVYNTQIHENKKDLEEFGVDAVTIH